MLGRCRCDCVQNNISESWNRYILKARNKSVIGLIEQIRKQLMARFQKKRDKPLKGDGILCPKIQKELEKRNVKARFCQVFYIGNLKFVVECKGKMTCGCR